MYAFTCTAEVMRKQGGRPRKTSAEDIHETIQQVRNLEIHFESCHNIHFTGSAQDLRKTCGRRAEDVLSAFANDIESCERVAKLKKPRQGCIAPSIIVKVFTGRLARETWCLISMGRGIEYMWMSCTQYIQRVTEQEIMRKTESYYGMHALSCSGSNCICAYMSSIV